MPSPTPSHAGDPSLVALCDAIRTLRKRQGVSQEALATDSGVERAYMGGIERGQQNLSVMKLVRITQALNVTLEELVAQAKL